MLAIEIIVEGSVEDLSHICSWDVNVSQPSSVNILVEPVYFSQFRQFFAQPASFLKTACFFQVNGPLVFKPRICLLRLSVRPSDSLKPKFGRLKTKFDDDAEKFGSTFYVFYFATHGLQHPHLRECFGEFHQLNLKPSTRIFHEFIFKSFSEYI